MSPSTPLPTLRYPGYIDVGNTYGNIPDIKGEPVHVGIGVGIH